MDEMTLKRLALIKYLFNEAVRQSHEAEPIYGLSILGFQDSIELFLQLACEKINVPVSHKKEPAFMEYFQLIRDTATISLSQETAVGRLNKSRVAFKHHGNLPSKSDITAHRVTAINFFEDNTPIIFNIEFSQISMISLVESSEAQDSLINATKLLSEGKTYEAINCVAVAFDQLLRYVHSKHTDRFGHSIYDFNYGKKLQRAYFTSADSHNRNLNDAISETGKQLEDIGDILKILLLGIDYPQYAKFKSLTPNASRTPSGKYEVTYFLKSQKLNAEQINDCIEFVITSALRTQALSQ